MVLYQSLNRTARLATMRGDFKTVGTNQNCVDICLLLTTFGGANITSHDSVRCYRSSNYFDLSSLLSQAASHGADRRSQTFL